MNEIPVVREYPDVFPEDILEFPREREIEFSIKLVLVTSVTPSKHKCHARVMELYLEAVTATVKGFVNKKILYIWP